MIPWLNWVSDFIKDLPSFSKFSTTNGPAASNITAPTGCIGIEIGSGLTKLWIKKAEASSAWSAIA